MRKSIFLFLIPALLIASGARAESQGWYMGLGLGSSNASFNSDDFSLGLPQVSESAEKTSTGAKLFGGYLFNRNFAIEFGLVSLGKFSYKYNGGAAGTAAFDYEVAGLAVSGVGFLPVSEDFSFFGRLGFFSSTAKTTLANASGAVATALNNAGFAVGSNDSASKMTICIGVGAQYDFAQRFAARLEYENFGEVGTSTDTGRATVGLISASLLYRF